MPFASDCLVEFSTEKELEDFESMVGLAKKVNWAKYGSIVIVRVYNKDQLEQFIFKDTSDLIKKMQKDKEDHEKNAEERKRKAAAAALERKKAQLEKLKAELGEK
jgi:hypothetical protein